MLLNSQTSPVYDMMNSPMDDVTEVTKCEVCDYPNPPVVLDLGSQPLPDDLIRIGDARSCRRYPVQVMFCERCGTAHQKFQVDKRLLFAPNYHYRAAQTKDVLDGMEQFVDSVEKIVPHCYGHVLDVGCNDGSLLDVFKRRGARKTCGIDPTDAADEAAAKGHGIDKAFLDAREALYYVKTYGHPNLITFTNVFAHIEGLNGLLANIQVLRNAETWVVIENHYLGSVLDRHQFDTFYQEHPRTYSLTSFEWIAKRLKMHIEFVEFPKRYGGNIRVILAPGVQGMPTDLGGEHSFGPRLLRMQKDISRWRDRKRQEILDYAPIAGVAMPARASVLVNLLGLTPKEMPVVFEKEGSKKIGYYVPGTRIPILSDAGQNLHVMYDNALLNLAWHIPNEIEARWRGLGFKGKMIQAVTPEDFK